MTIAAIFLPLLGAFIAGFFGRWIGNRGSQVITCAGVGIAAIYGVVLFILTVAAAEAAIGLAILVTYYRNRGTIAVEDIHMMKG